MARRGGRWQGLSEQPDLMFPLRGRRRTLGDWPRLSVEETDSEECPCPQGDENEDPEEPPSSPQKVGGGGDMGMGRIYQEPILSNKDSASTPLSKSLCLLILNDPDDMHLRTCSITDLLVMFLQEFPADPLQSFAVGHVVGFIETGRLNTIMKFVAATGMMILFQAKCKKSNNLGIPNVVLSSVFYVALRYGFKTPVRSENGVLSDMELYLIYRLFQSEIPTSSIWKEKLDVVVKKWEAEFHAIKAANLSSMDIIKRDLSSVVSGFEAFLLHANKKDPRIFGRSGDPFENLIAIIDQMAWEREKTRNRMRVAQQASMINEFMKKLLPEWQRYENMFKSSKGTMRDELLRALQHPIPDPTAKEMVWIVPSRSGAIGSGDGDEDVFQALMSQALKEALNITQRKQLIDEIKSNPDVIHFIDLSPSTLHDLVENNPAVAVEILVKYIGEKNQVKDYLAAMVHMEMSVHSMEVVNRLTSSIEVPKEFLYLYISNCIKTCEQIQDKFVQNRLVRLLCVFLQSLIRHKIIDIQDIYVEVIVFLLSFSRIREAASLFRLIRHVESEDAELRELISRKLEDQQGQGHSSSSSSCVSSPRP